MHRSHTYLLLASQHSSSRDPFLYCLQRDPAATPCCAIPHHTDLAEAHPSVIMLSHTAAGNTSYAVTISSTVIFCTTAAKKHPPTHRHPIPNCRIVLYCSQRPPTHHHPIPTTSCAGQASAADFSAHPPPLPHALPRTAPKLALGRRYMISPPKEQPCIAAAPYLPYLHGGATAFSSWARRRTCAPPPWRPSASSHVRQGQASAVRRAAPSTPTPRSGGRTALTGPLVRAHVPA